MIGRYAVLLLWVLIAAQGAAALAGEFGLAAKVNGIGITRAELEATFNAYLEEQGVNTGAIRDPAQYTQMKQQALELLIGQELLWQEAKKRGFTAAPAQVDQVFDQARKRYHSEDAFLRELKKSGFTRESYRENLKEELSVKLWVAETITKKISISEEEIHDYYVNNPHRFTRPEEVLVRHVLIKVAPDADQVEVAAARKRIEQVLAQTKQGADFAALAKKYSQGANAQRGGSLGYLPRGRVVKPFEDAAFALKPGELSDVVRTRYGFHIIKMAARRGGGVVSEQAAAPSIRAHLSQVKVRQAVMQRVQTLREQGSVEVLEAL